jgi:two-component system LytT family response regulator
VTIRALIVDDEPLARRRIRRLLRDHPDIDVVGDAGNVALALSGIQEQKPDLLFLDVQMPELDGFDLLAALPKRGAPRVVFTTAYDEYAVRAFEVHAIDYLLKPFSRARFDETIARVRSTLRDGQPESAQAALAAFFSRIAGGRPAVVRFVVKHDGRAIVVPPDQVTWIEADRNVVTLHTDRGPFTLGEGIARLESRLDPTRFVRIHRSTIVQLDRVVEVQPWFRGDAVVILRDGTRLTLSRRYRAKLSTALGQTL